MGNADELKAKRSPPTALKHLRMRRSSELSKAGERTLAAEVKIMRDVVANNGAIKDALGKIGEKRARYILRSTPGIAKQRVERLFDSLRSSPDNAVQIRESRIRSMIENVLNERLNLSDQTHMAVAESIAANVAADVAGDVSGTDDGKNPLANNQTPTIPTGNPRGDDFSDLEEDFFTAREEEKRVATEAKEYVRRNKLKVARFWNVPLELPAIFKKESAETREARKFLKQEGMMIPRMPIIEMPAWLRTFASGMRERFQQPPALKSDLLMVVDDNIVHDNEDFASANFIEMPKWLGSVGSAVERGFKSLFKGFGTIARSIGSFFRKQKKGFTVGLGLFAAAAGVRYGEKEFVANRDAAPMTNSAPVAPVPVRSPAEVAAKAYEYLLPRAEISEKAIPEAAAPTPVEEHHEISGEPFTPAEAQTFPGWHPRADLKTVAKFYTGFAKSVLGKKQKLDEVQKDPSAFRYLNDEQVAAIDFSEQIPTDAQQRRLMKEQGVNPRQWQLGRILDRALEQSGVKDSVLRGKEVAIMEHALATQAVSSKVKEEKMQINVVPSGAVVSINDGKLIIASSRGTKMLPLRMARSAM